jgi:uncharacterized membrane protein
MGEGTSTYRDELAAAQARIATLEAKIMSSRDDDTTEKWFAELRAQRAAVGAMGRRFWGLGSDGVGALVVATVLLGSGAVFGVLQGALVPALAVVALGGLFVLMMAFALRNGRKAHFAREIRRVEERISDANRAVSLAREDRLRIAAETEAPAPPTRVVESEGPERDEAVEEGDLRAQELPRS